MKEKCCIYRDRIKLNPELRLRLDKDRKEEGLEGAKGLWFA